MKLTGELKAKVESAAGMEEKKALIAEAGMELNDEELAAVAGGADPVERNGRHVFEETPVFKSPNNPGSSGYLPKGTIVQTISGSETKGAPAMSSYSPLIYITSPVKGWIQKSALFH